MEKPTITEENFEEQVFFADLDQISVLFSASVKVLDTRTEKEVSELRLKGTTFIPESDLFYRLFELPPRNVPFIVVCRSFHTYELLTLKNDWRNTFYVQPPNKNEELWQELKAHGFTESGIPENLPCLPYFPLFSPCRPLESLINEIERNVLKNHSFAKKNNRLLFLFYFFLFC